MIHRHLSNHYHHYVNAIKKGLPDNDVRKVIMLLYWTDFAERKAFIGSLYAELKRESDKIYDSESGYEVLKQTDAWKGFEGWQETVTKLNNIRGNKKAEKDILRNYNELCETKLTNYGDFLRMINRRWLKFKHSLETKVARLIYRLYCKNPGFGGTIFFDEYN